MADSAGIVQLISVALTAVASSGAVAAIFNRRNRQEREVDTTKLRAESENITTQAAATALAALRKELDAANSDLDRRRAVIQGQDERIDSQQQQIRRLRHQVDDLKDHIEALQDWVTQAAHVMQTAHLVSPPIPNFSPIETTPDL